MRDCGTADRLWNQLCPTWHPTASSARRTSHERQAAAAPPQPAAPCSRQGICPSRRQPRSLASGGPTALRAYWKLSSPGAFVSCRQFAEARRGPYRTSNPLRRHDLVAAAASRTLTVCPASAAACRLESMEFLDGYNTIYVRRHRRQDPAGRSGTKNAHRARQPPAAETRSTARLPDCRDGLKVARVRRKTASPYPVCSSSRRRPTAPLPCA